MNFDGLSALLVTYGGRLLLAVITLLVGIRLTKGLLKIVARTFDKHDFDKSLRSFLLSIIRVGVYVLLGVTVASMLGVEMTSFVAILASAGLAVGLALQGSLSNFAGGVLILMLRPFSVGDFIEAAGHSGTVEQIQIFYTVLKTPDNQRVVMPNADLSNSSMINYSTNPTRRLNLVITTGYEDDITTVKSILKRLVDDHPLILEDPAPQVVLGEHGSSSLNYFLRAWTKSEDYWNVRFELLEMIKVEFDKESINIPYPQMDVHMRN